MPRAAVEPKIGPYTWDDFVKLDDDDRRELIDGELVEVEVPTCAHECIVAILIVFLGNWQRTHKKARVTASGFKVRISDRRGVMPDVQLVTVASRGRPELAVEVISPSSRKYDRVTKLEYYAAVGTPEYWIVDPDASTLERLVLHGARYLIADSLAGDAVFRPASFEGLEIPLAELWEAVVEGNAIEAAEDRAFRARQKHARSVPAVRAPRPKRGR